MSEEVTDQLSGSFAKVLNRHGYGFQFSVLKKVDELVKQRKMAGGLNPASFQFKYKGWELGLIS